jgi:hypothetical protein
VLKRELRKYADPGLKFSPGHGLLHTEAIDYIVRTAVRNIAGQRILAVYIYDRQDVSAPRYTLFQARREYTTLERMQDGALKWRAASLYNLLGCWPKKQCAFYTQQDQRRVTRFCDLEDKEGLKAIEALQEKIMNADLHSRTIAREKKLSKQCGASRPNPAIWRAGFIVKSFRPTCSTPIAGVTSHWMAGVPPADTMCKLRARATTPPGIARAAGVPSHSNQPARRVICTTVPRRRSSNV